MFSSLSYFWGETFRSLFRNRFMAIASVLTVTLSMFILGVFLSAVLNINHMASYLENQVEMTVYLKDGLTTDQVMGYRQVSESTARHEGDQIHKQRPGDEGFP